MIVGIDLGTTYSAIAYMNKDGKPNIIINSEGGRTTPSAVMFEEDGNVIVGDIAKDSAIIDECNVVEFIKNEMGNPKYRYRTNTGNEYTPEEISSFILKKLKMDGEKYLGDEITEAVITVPAYFNDTQRKATKHAGEIVGLEVKKIINEPTAAAIAYAMEKEIKDSNILVYDLGGGTFDATVVHYGQKDIVVRATDGIRRLGGHFFDIEIVNFVTKVFQEKHGVNLYDDDHIEALKDINKKAEECKIHLSMRTETYISVNYDGIKERIKITRDQFNEMIKRLYERTERVVLSVLQKADMTWKDIDEVLMVGGCSRIPYIQNRIETISGKNPSFEINPDEVVALGAAIQASILNKADNQRIRVQDVCSHDDDDDDDVDDEEKIMKILERNKEKSNQTAEELYKLGSVYLRGDKAPRDYQMAALYLLKASERGSSDAQYALGWCYEEGKGVPKDYGKAVEWYRKSAEQKNKFAQNDLGLCYETGKGVPKDFTKAAYWYRRSAEQGYECAQYRLGICYQNGQGVIQDYGKAAEYYKQAADRGNPYAKYNLGCCYNNGYGVNQNYLKTVELWENAANQGNVSAIYGLGWCYENAKGVGQNYSKMIQLWQKAADQGNANALCSLGRCYENAKGVVQDYRRAAELYLKAANQGSDVAQNKLGLLYENGYGVKKDKKVAKLWYLKAFQQGNKEAAENLKRVRFSLW